MNTTTRPTRMAPPPGVASQQQLPQTTEQQRPATMVMAPSAPAQKAYPPKIAKAILYVTRNINPVAKAGFNDFHKYAYRKFEDVFEELVPLINDAGLIIQQSEITHGAVLEGMIAITYQFTMINEDGDVWPDRPEITAICKVKDHKGMLDDKAASKCNTQAQKYFYTSFFKIRSVDTTEADADAPTARPARRTAPNPQGEFQPYEIVIKEGETAQQWGERFKGMLKHAKIPDDVDAWWAANQRIFARLNSQEGYKPLVDDLTDAMDRRVIELSPQQEVAQPVEQKQGGFPGDKPMTAATMPDIPQNLRRAPPPPPELTQQEQDWLNELEAEYKQCSKPDELAESQNGLMLPWQGHVSKNAWELALAKTKDHLERVSKTP